MSDQATGLLSPYLRVQRIKAALPHIIPPVLDIGCGNGSLAPFFKAEDYTGMDIDEEALAEGRAAPDVLLEEGRGLTPRGLTPGAPGLKPQEDSQPVFDCGHRLPADGAPALDQPVDRQRPNPLAQDRRPVLDASLRR